MMGNVMEWTSTTFDYYRGFTGGMNPKVGTDVYKTIRGLSFAAEKEKMQRVNLLLTYRQPVTPDSKFDFLGFRLVCRPKT
jgi:formylglycine-generating enzyme required for sulfatase activity